MSQQNSATVDSLQQWRYYFAMSTIKTIRERLSLTQSALAEGVGCTQGNVGHYERGQTVPPEMAKRLIALAKKHGLDLTMDQVYGLADLPPATPVSRPEVKQGA